MMHLTSVDFPAPFSPSSACTLPGLTVTDDVVERDQFAELLAHTDRLDADRAIAMRLFGVRRNQGCEILGHPVTA